MIDLVYSIKGEIKDGVYGCPDVTVSRTVEEMENQNPNEVVLSVCIQEAVEKAIKKYYKIYPNDKEYDVLVDHALKYMNSLENKLNDN